MVRALIFRSTDEGIGLKQISRRKQYTEREVAKERDEARREEKRGKATSVCESRRRWFGRSEIRNGRAAP